MPCLSMYLDRPDTTLLLAWLNDDPEIAFLVLAGRKTRPTKKLRQLLASGQGCTFYDIGGLSSLVHIENRWIAVPRLETLPDGRYTLWHVPSGPLPLLYGNQPGQRGPACEHPHVGRAMTLAQALGREDGIIEDPWSGWVERNPGRTPASRTSARVTPA